MVDALLSWPTFVAALAIFGFAPRAVLRLLVLAFRRDDPRRQELLAELQAVPRLDRPFWVIEQLEVALCEGILTRIRVAGRAALGRSGTRILSIRWDHLGIPEAVAIAVSILPPTIVYGLVTRATNGIADATASPPDIAIRTLALASLLLLTTIASMGTASAGRWIQSRVTSEFATRWAVVLAEVAVHDAIRRSAVDGVREVAAALARAAWRAAGRSSASCVD